MASLLEFFKRLTHSDTMRMLFFACGIIGCFFVYGIMQEKVMSGCFGGEMIDGKCSGERFVFEMSLVFIYCIWYAVFARFLIFVNNKFPILHVPDKDKTFPIWYLATAFCYISAMVCSTMALRFINYPTQVIAKSSKPIPVMILGVLLAGKRYTIQKYFFVLLVVVGVILFVYKEGKTSEHENNFLGLTLVGMSLLADGVLGGVEERIRKTSKPTALNIMSSINMFSAIILLVIVIASQEVFKFVAFVERHPDVMYKIGAAAFVGSFGQIFIFLMISNFGSLPTSIATTTRKFFNVLVSVFFMGNPLITRQWIATGIIFSALFADILFGRKYIWGPKPDDYVVQNVDGDVEKALQNGKSVEMEKLKDGKELIDEKEKLNLV